MTKTYEAIVVGAGPAGSVCGYTLAKSNKRVLIIDKEKFPRPKLCAGMLTEKSIKMLKTVFGRINWDEIIDSSYNTFEIYHRQYGFINRGISSRNKLYLVDRRIFDNFLLQKAIQAGCDFQQKNIIDLKDLKADLIIGADGANSVVRRSFTPEINRRDYSLALEIEAEKSAIEEIKYPRIYFGYVNYGYAWVFPRRDKVVVGLGGLTAKNKENMRDLFVNFLKDVLKTDYRTYRILGYPLPFHNFINRPIQDNLRLVGDAAGLADPLTGEGIYYAIESGYLAAQSVYSYQPIHRVWHRAKTMRNIFYSPLFHLLIIHWLKADQRLCRWYFDLLSGV